MQFILLLLLLVLLCWTTGLVQKSAIGGSKEELISISYNSEKKMPMASIRKQKHGTRITSKSQGDHKDLKDSIRSDDGKRSMYAPLLQRRRRQCKYTTDACSVIGGTCIHYKDSCSSNVVEEDLCDGHSCICCKTGALRWDRYYRAVDIAAFANALAHNYSHVKVLKLGNTYERRPIHALVFSQSSKRNKRSFKMVNNERNLHLLNNISNSRHHTKYMNGNSLNKINVGKQMPVKRKQKHVIDKEIHISEKHKTFASKRKRKYAVKEKMKDSKERQKATVTNKKFRNKKKPVIMIEAGAHAREWISPAVATYIAQQLATSGSGDLLKHFTWVVVPLLNPDGYDYTHTHDRYWRKNRRPNKGSPDCPGVDLNRNFNIKWASTIGSRSDHCSEFYHGKKAFSEKETKAMKKLLKKFQNVKLYLSLHCYGQIILHPWAYTSDKAPDFDNLRTIANAFSAHISNNGGRTYAVEQSGIEWPDLGGVSIDYAYSRGIPYSYTVELPDHGTDGFYTPPEKILSISQEIWTGLRCLLGDLVPDAKPLC